MTLKVITPTSASIKVAEVSDFNTIKDEIEDEIRKSRFYEYQPSKQYFDELCVQLGLITDHFRLEAKWWDNWDKTHITRSFLYNRSENFMDLYEIRYEIFRQELQCCRGRDSSSFVIKSVVADMDELIENCVIRDDITNLKRIVERHPLAFRRINNIKTCIQHGNFEAYKLMEPLYKENDWGKLIEASLELNTPTIFAHLVGKHPVRKIYRWLKMFDKMDWKKYVPSDGGCKYVV